MTENKKLNDFLIVPNLFIFFRKKSGRTSKLGDGKKWLNLDNSNMQ